MLDCELDLPQSNSCLTLLNRWANFKPRRLQAPIDFAEESQAVSGYGLLQHIVIGTRFDYLNHGLPSAITGYYDYRHGLKSRANPNSPQHLHPIALRHAEVQQNRIWADLLGFVDCFQTINCWQHEISVAKNLGEERTELIVIVRN